MTKILRRSSRWLAALAALAIAVAAFGESPSSELGREVAIPVHLKDGEEFDTPMVRLIQYGGRLFNAKFTVQEGAGRPQSKGTGAPPRTPARRWYFRGI